MQYENVFKVIGVVPVILAFLKLFLLLELLRRCLLVLVLGLLRAALNVAPLMAILTRGQTIWDLNSPPGEETSIYFFNAVVKKLCCSIYDLVMNE